MGHRLGGHHVSLRTLPKAAGLHALFQLLPHKRSSEVVVGVDRGSLTCCLLEGGEGLLVSNNSPLNAKHLAPLLFSQGSKGQL